MEEIELAPDFKEFLNLLNTHHVKYLLVGGYAVALHGYPRATNDIDIWVEKCQDNAEKLVRVFCQFGFSSSSIDASAFLDKNRILRVGLPPICIDVLMSVSGLDFATCFARHSKELLDGVSINLLSREDLETNKNASGRLKDLSDIENLPPINSPDD